VHLVEVADGVAHGSVVRDVAEVAVGGEEVVLGRARLGRCRRGGQEVAGAEACGGGGDNVEVGAGTGVGKAVHAGAAVGPGLAAGAALLLVAVVMDAARAEALEGVRAGRAHSGDGALEAEGAPVALGDGLDDLHDLVVRHAQPAALGDSVGDALPASLALLVEAVVMLMRAPGMVARPLGAWRRSWRRRSLTRRPRCRRPGIEAATRSIDGFRIILNGSCYDDKNRSRMCGASRDFTGRSESKQESLAVTR
jgi:hypothetical protein